MKYANQSDNSIITDFDYDDGCNYNEEGECKCLCANCKHTGECKNKNKGKNTPKKLGLDKRVKTKYK